MELQNKNALFLELLLDCPIGTREEDCPLNNIVKAAYDEKIALIDKLTEDDMINTIKYHNDCYDKRKIQ